MTIRVLHHIIPEVSKTTIHEAVTEKLGYRKLRKLGAQNVNGRSQNETDGFCNEVSHTLCTGRRVSGPHVQRCPLVSSTKETSWWQKVRRR